MNIYISGISGTGMGPLALMAKQAGFEVMGSDLSKGAIYDELIKAGIKVKIGKQNGKFFKKCLKDGIDWFAYTSALPKDHAELVAAKKAGIKYTKRDDLTAFLVEKLGLKMIAVAGTHGKTTTTSMIIYVARKIKLPVAYMVGTTLGFAPSGSYKKGDKFFVYEADEYDRNFLKYHPWLAVLQCVTYNHPDIYPTKKDYRAAFSKFKSQSNKVIEEGMLEKKLTIAGAERRHDASLAAAALLKMAPRMSRESLVYLLNKFPGVGRRFEKIAKNVYSDYAHHPEEIESTIKTALEEKERLHKKGVVVVYEPHQNSRQHKVIEGYKNAFVGADKVFWLPTYLVRENSNLKIYQPADFIKKLSNKEIAEPAKPDWKLAKKLRYYINKNYLVVLMTAGPADEWLRKKFQK